MQNCDSHIETWARHHTLQASCERFASALRQCRAVMFAEIYRTAMLFMPKEKE